MCFPDGVKRGHWHWTGRGHGFEREQGFSESPFSQVVGFLMAFTLQPFKHRPIWGQSITYMFM